MKCPQCGQPYTIMLWTDPEPGNTVTRRRRCLACKFQFETVELFTKAAERQAWQASLFQAMCKQHEKENGREP